MGVKSLQCHAVVKEIWCWVIERSIHLSAEHLPGSENILADKASRIFDENTEWELVENVFREVRIKLGGVGIDLFASRLNKKCETYVSWKPDPGAKYIDAFSLSWKDLDFYAFPPVSMILRSVGNQEREGMWFFC